MVTPESSSASSRLGLMVWSLPREPLNLPALAVETGSAKMGTVTCSHSQAMDSSGMLASTTTSWALLSTLSRLAR